MAFHLDVRLIEAPTSIGPLEVTAAALVQLWSVYLNPPPHAAGADEQASFYGHLGHLGDREGVPQIPAHTPQDDVTRIMSPFEGIGCGNRHVSR